MTKKRIIPCLDVKDGKVVKGIHFTDIRVIGEPEECALQYERQGADELVLLDISATVEGRKTMTDVVRRTASVLSIPLTVGGGIGSLEDIEAVLSAGASKVSINSAAVKNPDLIREVANKYGSHRIVVAIDGIHNEKGGYNVVIDGGEVDTGIDVVQWAKEVSAKGAGEILLTSKDADGTKDGYDLIMTKAVCDGAGIPVIASGGCGTVGHIVKLFQETNADGALAASIFHYGDLSVMKVKEFLLRQGIQVTTPVGKE